MNKLDKRLKNILLAQKQMKAVINTLKKIDVDTRLDQSEEDRLLEELLFNMIDSIYFRSNILRTDLDNLKNSYLFYLKTKS